MFKTDPECSLRPEQSQLINSISENQWFRHFGNSKITTLAEGAYYLPVIINQQKLHHEE